MCIVYIRMKLRLSFIFTGPVANIIAHLDNKQIKSLVRHIASDWNSRISLDIYISGDETASES